MVEVEHDRMCLSAIDARMREEIREHQDAVPDPVPLDARDLAFDVVVAIREVVRMPIRRLALPAVTLAPPLRDVSEGEVRVGFGLATHVAGEHGRLRGTAANTSGRPLEHVFYHRQASVATGIFRRRDL